MNPQEIFPIVTKEGTVIGKATRYECHSGSMLLHPVVHLHLFNPEKKLYLQKRSMSKDIQPGKWDTSVGGHVDYGESILQALLREAREELGLTGIIPVPLYNYLFQSEIEREMVHTFYAGTYETAITPDKSEIDTGAFWSIEKIKANIGKGIFTPNFELEFSKLLPRLPAILTNNPILPSQ